MVQQWISGRLTGWMGLKNMRSTILEVGRMGTNVGLHIPPWTVANIIMPQIWTLKYKSLYFHSTMYIHKFTQVIHNTRSIVSLFALISRLTDCLIASLLNVCVLSSVKGPLSDQMGNETSYFRTINFSLSHYWTEHNSLISPTDFWITNCCVDTTGWLANIQLWINSQPTVTESECFLFPSTPVSSYKVFHFLGYNDM